MAKCPSTSGETLGALATGGVSEVLALAQAAGDQNGTGGGGGGQQGSAPGGAPQGDTCCRRYEIEAPFLLDTQTGRVWRYNDKKNVFEIVEREATKPEKVAESLVTARFAVALADSIPQLTKGATLNEHNRTGALYETLVKTLDERVKQFKV